MWYAYLALVIALSKCRVLNVVLCHHNQIALSGFAYAEDLQLRDTQDGQDHEDQYISLPNEKKERIPEHSMTPSVQRETKAVSRYLSPIS